MRLLAAFRATGVVVWERRDRAIDHRSTVRTIRRHHATAVFGASPQARPYMDISRDERAKIARMKAARRVDGIRVAIKTRREGERRETLIGLPERYPLVVVCDGGPTPAEHVADGGVEMSPEDLARAMRDLVRGGLMATERMVDVVELGALVAEIGRSCRARPATQTDPDGEISTDDFAKTIADD